MSLTKTPICNFGEKAKDFNLKSIENKVEAHGKPITSNHLSEFLKYNNLK